MLVDYLISNSEKFRKDTDKIDYMAIVKWICNKSES